MTDRIEEIRARQEIPTRSSQYGSLAMRADIAYLLGVADDAQDAIYVLAGCVAKEREENDRLQSRLQRAEKSLDEAAHALLNRGQQ